MNNYTNREIEALNILIKKVGEKDFNYLGKGDTFIVFTDFKLIYKVFLPKKTTDEHFKSRLLQSLEAARHKFENSLFLYPILDIYDISNHNFIVVYPFENSQPCESFANDEIQNFLVECWQKRLIFHDIKPNNFVRTSSGLKFIDIEPDFYSAYQFDNLFLNMVTRSFIYLKYWNKPNSFIKKLCRSAINQFDLPELEGLQAFINTVFTKIIYQESLENLKEKDTKQQETVSVSNIKTIKNQGTYDLPYTDNFDAEKAFWLLLKQDIYLENITFDTPKIDINNYFSPNKIVLTTQQIVEPKEKVSLIIKACVQDAEIIYQVAKHIIRQLSFPNKFDEKIIALDIRQQDFIRAYNNQNSWEELLQEVQRLVDDLVIDKFIFMTNEEERQAINEKWFGLKTTATHTIKKVPVTSQLFAFEQAKNDFVLQMDCDVMIGRLSHEHSFLNDMILELNKDENVLSVGFNIYKGKTTTFTNYFGFENGGFVPEVRLCLLKKSNIEKVLPIKNELVDNQFKLSWYRALEQHQKAINTYSIRGGDSRSFYIHPQNFKKTDKDVWFTMLDRVEQNQIPDCQAVEFDLAGSYYDWTMPKRNEKMVIVSCFRNIPLSRFLRYWYALISQSYQDWGLILIDDASDNGIHHFIKNLIKPFQNKVTFIQNRFRVGDAQNVYKAIHYFANNQESIICMYDADDALIGRNALKKIDEKYTFLNADVVIGKMYRTDKLQAHYKYKPNFTNPRLNGGNVWQHIRTFKKYLFDSLDFSDLKIKNQQKQSDDILLAKRFSQKNVFPEYCSDFTHMIPIVEMSSNPMWINHFNILHDRMTINTPEIKQRKEIIIAEVLNKPKKTSENIVKGRRTFLPNLNQIEIDITYECNLKCINCNRSSTQAPIKEGMTLAQIQQFVQESIELNKKWKLINLLGGEPTIHQDFLEIVRLILEEYIIQHSPETILQVTSNGFGELVQTRLAQLPQHENLIIDYASFKDERKIPYFSPFNDAPIDSENSKDKAYHKGCWVTAYCGIGLNQLGYYPCGVAGGIDRVFQLNLGVQSLKDVDENIAQYLDTFCRYCGNFTDYERNAGNFIPRHEKAALTKPIISKTWKNAYKQYNRKKI